MNNLIALSLGVLFGAVGFCVFLCCIYTINKKEVNRAMKLKEKSMRFCDECNKWKDKKKVRYLVPNSEIPMCDVCYNRMRREMSREV